MRLCCISHRLVLAPGLLPPLCPSPKRSQQLLPSATTDADARSWSCQGYTSGLEWESLTSSSARDGRMADWPTGTREEKEREEGNENLCADKQTVFSDDAHVQIFPGIP